MIHRQLREVHIQYGSDVLGIPVIECAWAAGFFEGEGSVRIERSKSTHGQLMVEISQVDKSPLQWLADRWNGRIYLVKAHAHRGRPFFRWTASTHDAAVFLTDIRPYIVREIVATKIGVGLEFNARKMYTHANRTPEYRQQQAAFFDKMAELNRRGVERAAMAGRL